MQHKFFRTGTKMGASALCLLLVLSLIGCAAAPSEPDPALQAEIEAQLAESAAAAKAESERLEQQNDLAQELYLIASQCKRLVLQNDWTKDQPTVDRMNAAIALLQQQQDGQASEDWNETAAATIEELNALLPTLMEKRPPVIEQIDGVTYADGVLIVNKTYSVPKEYGGAITLETQDAFDTMQAAAAADGIILFICSGYRDYNYQRTLYRNYAARDGYAAADTYSARPGHSEHQTGLALDINSTDGSMATSPEGVWLAAHCAEYGFIIRYPEGKQDITGYMYEPWHIRYVGAELAQELTESGLTMEEYFGLTSVYAEE